MAPEFLELLKKGKFAVPVCTSCQKKAWPPSAHCSFCFSKTRLEPTERDGVLEELADSHVSGREGTFGIIRMDGFRLIGSLDRTLHRGTRVRMTACGIGPDGSPFYRFAPAK